MPFLLLAVLFAGTDWVAMRRVSQVRAEVEHIEQDMLTDIELVSRMRHDIDRVKLLTDQHVFERGSAAMAALEVRIDQTVGDFAAAADEYESMPMLPGEEAPWRDLKAVTAELRPRLDKVLAPSRLNDDPAAHGNLAELQKDFDRANDALRSLIDFNQRTAHESIASVAKLQQSATVTLQVLALVGVTLSVLVGVLTARALQLRNAQLHDHADKLEASNRELDAFAGRVAHDLRGPLTTATLATSRLGRQSLSPEQLKSLDALQRSFGRMGGIIQDLLAISRAQASTPGAVCDPAAAAEELREELAPRVQDGDVNLVIDVQPASVRCSEGLLRQVMWNLTDNAMKYRRTAVRSRVEICGRPADDGYELSVRDNGVGISPDDTSKVFQPFYRVDPEKGEPGTGLGLSIVKRAVEANGGTVSVTSEPGSGSTFVARLPLA
jgi:nitrogen-specific signal transduction histidine kinase